MLGKLCLKYLVRVCGESLVRRWVASKRVHSNCRIIKVLLRANSMILLSIASLFLLSTEVPKGCIGSTFPLGTRTHSYIDADRGNRVVSVLLRYPAQPPGGENAAPLLGCQFRAPMLSFAHGFTIANSSYDYFARDLARLGFAVVLPGTEAGLAPNHLALGLDLRFAANAVFADPFFAGALSGERVYGGHSMGGGAAILAAAKDRSASGLFVMAPAETNPSAIAAASKVRAPSYFVVGSRDCVTPRASNADAIFDAMSFPGLIKYVEEFEGGSHCQFAAASFTCQLAEQACGGQPTMSEQDQQNITGIVLREFLFASAGSNDTVYVDDFE